MVIERSLCQVGIPCVVQEEVDNALQFLTNAITILEGPLDAIIKDVEATAAALLKIAGELEADVAGLTVALAEELEAQVVAAISALIGDIKADLTIITSGVAAVTADLTAAVNDVLSAIVAIEAVIGPCTT